MFEVKRGRLGDDRLLGNGDRPAQPRGAPRRSCRGPLVGGVDAAVLLDEGAGHDRQLMAEVVEDDEQVGDHQRHVRQPERVGVGLGQRLDGADQVVAEEPDGAAGERRQALDRSRPVAAELLGDGRVGVGRVVLRPLRVGEDAIDPAQYRARRDPDERVTADLALLGGLEQEAGSALGLAGAQLEEGGDRGLAVVDEGRADRDDVAALRQPPRLLEARLEPQLGVSGDGH